MPRALIADDEPQLARHLAEQLRTLWPELEIVAMARNGLEAAEGITALQPDLAFLDIQMPGLTGLEVAQGIEGQTQVIFVTAYDQHAVQAFEAEALDYLLKPVSQERLARTVERVRRALSSGPPEAGAEMARALRQLQSPPQPAGNSARLRWVRASQGDTTLQIPLDQVILFHADDKYTMVHTAQGEHLIRTPISDLLAQVDNEQFVQVHRATLINMAHLHSCRRDEASRLWLTLRGNAREWPVSRAYVHLFKAM
jgi:DNA-binding LytR/AlgR family response regulator